MSTPLVTSPSGSSAIGRIVLKTLRLAVESGVAQNIIHEIRNGDVIEYNVTEDLVILKYKNAISKLKISDVENVNLMRLREAVSIDLGKKTRDQRPPALPKCLLVLGLAYDEIKLRKESTITLDLAS